jgi:5S rRNA maturation endonuclease (ribonuclease M5)
MWDKQDPLNVFKKSRRQFRLPRVGEIEAFLSGRVKVLKRESKGELRFSPCPACGRSKTNESTTINSFTGLWHCFSCQSSGGWFKLTQLMGEPLRDPFENEVFFEDVPELISKIEKKRKNPPVLVSQEKYPSLLNYLIARGLTVEALDDFKVSSYGEQCIRFPLHIWSDDGWLLVNGKIKRCLGEGLKSWFEFKDHPTQLLIGQHLLHESNGEFVIITEGEIDALSGYSIGLRNICSLPNGASSVYVASLLQWIPESWEVWLCVDMDEAGDKCAEQFYNQLGFEGVSRFHLPTKDLNDWLKKDPMLTKEKVMETLKGQSKISLTKKQKAFLKIGSKIEPIASKIVCETPWHYLTTLLGGGFIQRQTSGILAPSGIGKSTFVNQIAIHAAWRDVTVGLISLEGDRASLDQNLSTAISGWTGYLPTSFEFAQVATKLLVSELEGIKTTVEQVLDEVKILIESGASLVIVDNFDYIMSRTDPRSHELKAQAYASLIEMAMRYNIHAISVWQPHKVSSRSKVDSGNQKGLSQALQDSDNYLVLNRFKDSRRLDLEKCRSVGIADESFVMLKYESKKRCLVQLEKSHPYYKESQTTFGGSLFA